MRRRTFLQASSVTAVRPAAMLTPTIASVATTEEFLSAYGAGTRAFHVVKQIYLPAGTRITGCRFLLG